MYLDLREVYWWSSMKKYIAEFVAKCPNCQQVKVEHQSPGGINENIDLSEWKWEMINMDFITGLPSITNPCIINFVPNDPLEFEVDDWVYLKVSPMKGVMRFGKKGKLGPQYIGPDRISKRIGNVAYELELPPELAAVYPTFHISMLKKCMSDHLLIILTKDIGIKDNISYEEIPIEILDHQVRKLRPKEVASVKFW
ncbi:hypothetical protein MTR67_048592 [Solanum verrucosum]|uniref:Integrase zinc-binding domain-containing protein n=1 Tax=Solanum verrucosum TaxID=315347 RepID=A0AAF0UYR1_SOLVR|nr:hypothetical protein MTR67_048592 [Solanum verrucosum]